MQRAALVGHSFGGASAARSTRWSRWSWHGPLADLRAELVDRPPHPVLLVHGTADAVLPNRCSLHLYALAGEPKEEIVPVPRRGPRPG